MAKTITNIGTAVTISALAVGTCHIDFMSLCDKNDFALLTNEYSTFETIQLAQTIENGELRSHFLHAIKLAKRLSEIEKDNEKYEEAIDIMMEQAKLQDECKATYLKLEINKTDRTANNIKQGKGFTARQWGLFAYFHSEAEGIYYDGNTKNQNDTICKKALSKISGLKEDSFKGLIIPDYESQQSIRDMNLIADTIREIFPKTYNCIMDHLESEGF